MENIWKTKEDGTIESAVQGVCDAMAQHGGIMVEQVVTKTGNVLRACDGWEIELCHDGVRLRLHAELTLFTYAGDFMPTSEELEASADADLRAEQACRSMVDADFDAMFDDITSDYPDAPEVELVAAE